MSARSTRTCTSTAKSVLMPAAVVSRPAPTFWPPSAESSSWCCCKQEFQITNYLLVCSATLVPDPPFSSKTRVCNSTPQRPSGNEKLSLRRSPPNFATAPGKVTLPAPLCLTSHQNIRVGSAKIGSNPVTSVRSTGTPLDPHQQERSRSA